MQSAKKNLHRILLDLLLMVLLASLYRKNAISLTYHEIAGLVLLAFGLIHLWLQRRWLSAMLQRIRSALLPAQAKCYAVVDCALLLALLSVIGSGICISKVLFSVTLPGPWKTIHYFSAALTLLLAGVHTGLHGAYLAANLKQLIPFPSCWKKPLATVLLAVCFFFGGYTVYASSFIDWLTMPFQAAVLQNGYGAQNQQRYGAADIAPDQQAKNGSSNATPHDTGSYRQRALQNPKGSGNHQSAFSLASLLQTVAAWFSVLIFFALLTHWCLLQLHRISHRKD